MALYLGTDHPAGTNLVGENRPSTSDLFLGTSRYLRTGHRTRVLTLEPIAPGAPELGYVLVPELDAKPFALSLVAFPSSVIPAGRVLTPPEAAEQKVASDTQVAAVRWIPEDGVIHQVYVHPSRRRQGISHKLLLGTGLVAAAHGWRAVHGGEDRTDLGDLMLQGAPDAWQGYLDTRVKSSPPMDSEPAPTS